MLKRFNVEMLYSAISTTTITTTALDQTLISRLSCQAVTNSQQNPFMVPNAVFEATPIASSMFDDDANSSDLRPTAQVVKLFSLVQPFAQKACYPCWTILTNIPKVSETGKVVMYPRQKFDELYDVII